jgi:uncharacterized tellurite resistance protein B-like protein
MKQLEIGLKVATLPVMVLAVGIGVDYAFYIYSRLQHHVRRGYDVTTAFQQALLETGNAVVFTGITLAIGVSTWAFSPLKFQADMGLLLAFMFTVNMLMTATALPALAVVLEAAAPHRARTPSGGRKKLQVECVLEWLRGGGPRERDEERGRVAVAALLVECSRVDAMLGQAERCAIAEGVARLFDLDDEVAECLVGVAGRRLDDVWHDWLFTRAVRSHFDLDARVELLRKLWNVALANGLLHPREDAFLTRIARELDVPEDRLAECRGARRSDPDPSRRGPG